MSTRFIRSVGVVASLLAATLVGPAASAWATTTAVAPAHHPIYMPTVAEINGARAIAQTRMAIMVRSALDGVEVDAACYGRFFDRVEKRGGSWRIAKRSVIYEKDRIDPVDPGTVISLDLALLRRFPEGYRHLAYLQTKNGAQVNPNLPTAHGEALEKLLREAQAWLAAAL